MNRYLIAFGRRPKPDFLSMLRSLAKSDGVEITGARLVDGPGCANLAIIVNSADHENFVRQLTMALQPAKYERCDDPTLVEGEFVDEISR